jgi:arylsulfatase A-like enzyme
VRVPLAIRWGAELAAPGRRVTDFTSLPDLAPTFLEAAGADIPEQMTARSLMPILRTPHGGRVDASRDAVVVGRERHTPAQAPPSTGGYPSRALRTDRWLYIMNLAPERWPAGAPGTSTRGPAYADCDGGPTKAYIVGHREEAACRRSYELCFARRPSEELYDVQADPYQLTNLASAVQHAETARVLRERLTTYLRETGDPRFTDEPVRFDEYPYGGRLAAR